MSRDVPYDEKEICDICGKKGAFDFIGDCYCSECLSNPKYFKQEGNEKSD
jgi:predicted amidophosphoribosyltransferase